MKLNTIKKTINTAENANSVVELTAAENFGAWMADELKQSVVKGTIKILWKIIITPIKALFNAFLDAPVVILEEKKPKKVYVLNSSSSYADKDGYVSTCLHPNVKGL